MDSVIDPLPPEKCDALEEAALDEGPKERLIVQAFRYAGLRQTEFRHMRRSWLDDDYSLIRIPPESRCTVQAGGPCDTCRNRGGVWKPRSGFPKIVRAVPIWHDGLQDILRWWFREHEAVAMASKTLRYYLDKLAELAGLDPDEVSGTRMRYSYGVFLAQKGFEKDTIREVMGYEEAKPYGDRATQFYRFAEKYDEGED